MMQQKVRKPKLGFMLLGLDQQTSTKSKAYL